MKRRLAMTGLAALLGAGAMYSYGKLTSRNGKAAAERRESQAEAELVAAGRVEPVSEEIRIASEFAGRLQEVRVEEGDRVRKGQVIAVVENSDYRARVSLAEARLLAREAELRRLVNGARGEERREARAAVDEARAVMENARAEMERRRRLHRSGDISRSEAERAEREFLVARARVEAAGQRYSFIDARAREEDRDRAEAEIAAARAQVDLARANLQKTIIRAPLSGVVLRKHLKTGESVADGPDTPIVTMANDDVLRVRVDIDETDVAKVRVGQEAYVTADAYGAQRFHGRVVRVGQILGKKTVRTDEPTERIDTKILETLVEFDQGERLPAGLRVTAHVAVRQ